jgi:hypothetical protein
LEELGRQKVRLTSELEDRSKEAARAQSAENDKSLLNSHIQWLQGRLDEESEKASKAAQSFEETRRRLEAMLQSQAQSLGAAEQRIMRFVNGRVDWRDRLRQMAGLAPSSAAYRQLAEWRPKIEFTNLFAGPAQLTDASVQGNSMLLPTNQRGRNPYLRANSLAELLLWNDVDFVRCAYVTILGRQPDRDGEAHFTHRLRAGDSKYALIWQLRRSGEGRKHDPGIAGLDRALKREKLRRHRLFGWLIRVLLPGEGGSRQDRSFRQLLNISFVVAEQQSRQIDEMIATRANIEELSAGLDKIAGNLNRLGEFMSSGIAPANSPPDSKTENLPPDPVRSIGVRDDVDLSSRERALLWSIQSASYG